MKIGEIDPNLALDACTGEKDTVFLDVCSQPFLVTGVLAPTPQEPFFRRMPQALARSISPGVEQLNRHTAGGQVRFRTDSPYVSLHAVQSAVCLMSHMTVCGIGGFDLYAREDGGEDRYAGTFRPPFALENGFDAIVRLPGRRMRTFTLNMPLYGGVNSLYLGLDREATLEPAPAPCRAPLAFYGSSITQGGCASRPGNSYPAMLSRALGCAQINLGFSGNGKGEPEMARYIASLRMSAFVMDYDNNSPTPQTLRATHEPFFRIIRQVQPRLPVIFVSRPPMLGNDENPERADIIRQTYQNALDAGDRHVFLVNGSTFFSAFEGDSATVDGCHPNDYGFALMAQRLLPVLERALNDPA